MSHFIHTCGLVLRRLAAAAVALEIACAPGKADIESGIRLQPRVPGSIPTLFESLPSSVTGVAQVNSFDDPRCWGELYRAFNNGSLGTGVAVADFDGDGRPDIAAAAKTGPVALYRNLGQFRFEDVTEKAGLFRGDAPGSRALGWLRSAVGTDSRAGRPWSHGVVFADVDNNGWVDLYVCRFGAPNLLYMNRGDGTFSEEAAARGLAISDASVVASFCDYDRDGWLDVYLQTNLLDERVGPDGQRDYLLRNQGRGVFVDTSDRLTPRLPSQGHSCAWWDYDDDGWPDLYVANDFAGPDLLYHNKGDGTFVDVASRVLPNTPFSSMGCDTADVDGDGLVDLFVADMAATSHVKDQRTMAAARYLAPAPNPGEAPQVSRNMLYLGTGMGRVREAAYVAGLAASDWTWSPRFEDFDCDGRIDLLITNGMNREHHNVDLHDRLNRLASPEARAAVVRDSPTLAERNLAFRNDGTLRFVETGRAWGFSEVGISFGSASGDFDGDGDLDLVVARYNESPAIYKNHGSDGERVVIRLEGVRSNRFGVGAKVWLETSAGTQLREVWTARGYQSSSEPAAFFGFPAGDTVRRVQVQWPSGLIESWAPFEPGFAYEMREGTGLTGGSRPEPRPVFQQVGVGSPDRAPLSRSPDGALLKSSRLQPLDLSRLGPGIAAVDIDQNGTEEVLVAGGAGAGILRVGSDLRIESMSGLPSRSPGPLQALEDGPLLVFDANFDGYADLLASRTGDAAGPNLANYGLRLWIADGRGGFTAAAPGVIPDRPISAGVIAAADFDQDGALDVFIGSRLLPGLYPQAGDNMLLRWHSGMWIDACRETGPELAVTGMVTGALWSDVDDDGWLDLVVTCEWGRVRCFFNSRDGHLAERRDYDPFGAAGAGWWTSIGAADFNRDGRIDYLVGNAGLNTHYRASIAEPALLMRLPAGRSRTATALLEVHHEDGRRFPWRTRRDLGGAWPAIIRKYPTNDSFAVATIEEIFGVDAIAGADVWSAQELRAGVFLSHPDGSFVFQPLPNHCQLAPVYGVVAGDIDGDGLADACLLQNSTGHASGSWIGGMGQFLHGYGDGRFKVIAPRESGFVVPDEGRGLAVFDPYGAGRPMLAATRSLQPPVFFALTNQRSEFLAIRLRQPGNNPDALGARLQIEWSDHRISAAEVCGSAGYMTQSSTVTYVGLDGLVKPIRVTVRWPDGVQSRYSLPKSAGPIVLDRERGDLAVPE